MAILGLRDTKSYGDAGFRWENFRQLILYSFPNGSAPLTAVLALLESEGTNDPKYNWFSKNMATRRTAANANYTNVAASIVVDDKINRPGQLIMNETTREIMLVTSITGSGPYTLGVHRGEWGTAVAGTAGDFIQINGSAHAEGANTPTSLSTDPEKEYNYTEIFRNSWDLTGTALRTTLKFDPKGPYRARQVDALQDHSVEMEWAFVQGVRAEFITPGETEVTRTTGGVISYIDAENIVDVDVDEAGFLGESLFESYIERAFRTTSNRAMEKLALCGSNALAVANRAAKKGSHMQIVPGAEAFGMNLTRWITPHGTLYFKTHPLFTYHPVWRNHMLILDVRNLKYRYMNGRDTTILRNRQNPGQDKRVDEYLTECGIEVHHPKSHFFIKNIRCYTDAEYCADPYVGEL